MRLMENRDALIEYYAYSRPASFFDFSAKRAKQRDDIVPPNI